GSRFLIERVEPGGFRPRPGGQGPGLARRGGLGMANARWSAVGLGLGWLWGWLAVAGAAEAVRLREVNPTGQQTRVLIELKARGQVVPGAGPGSKQESKPLALRVEARLDFAERVVQGRPDGPARRVVRRVGQAAAAL